MKVERIKTEVKQELLMPEPVLTATGVGEASQLDSLSFLRYHSRDKNKWILFLLFSCVDPFQFCPPSRHRAGFSLQLSDSFQLCRNCVKFYIVLLETSCQCSILKGGPEKSK
jgi:hypothetical protein